MSDSRWEAVDRYFIDALVGTDAALDEALKESDAAGLPSVSVTAPQGKFLHLLVRIHGARKILEIGTLGGYSSIWMARALPPGGKLISLEAEPKHAEVARANIQRAGLANVIEVRVGKALDTLPLLEGPFDLVFIDADKSNNPAYFQWALKLSRPGTVIVVDNVVRDGAVVDPTSTNESVLGVRRMVELMNSEPRVSATAIQTVGGKGYDGFVLAVVNGS
ncbi:O-methyltransferase [Fimbriiglobus ruber]|uniref:O-methyltransferase n=1 Tax=Fimbriiglobus ruber TaxID=1908690 RepID=A0A225DQ59_9BACT|nr:O-methyltransferase [Fimbriiglobus ruber]OWK43590.1 O-methyltransferase [Fimbriiglobus ruber]